MHIAYIIGDENDKQVDVLLSTNDGGIIYSQSNKIEGEFLHLNETSANYQLCFKNNGNNESYIEFDFWTDDEDFMHVDKMADDGNNINR